MSTRSNYQHIIWPWETRRWDDVKKRLADKITSIVDMDSRIASIHTGKLRPRQITELFTTYYADSQYEKGRIESQFLIGELVPFMQKLVCNAPKIFRGFNARILQPGMGDNLALTRPQVATLIACIWFGLFNYNYLSKGKLVIGDFPEPTFINIFISQNVFALQCLLNYFTRVYTILGKNIKPIGKPVNDISEEDIFNAGCIILKRSTLESPPDWANSTTPMSEIFIGEGAIDGAPTKMHIASAHEFIGGDLFKNALTQEEVVLLIRPECLVATIFCARLDDDVLTIFGAEKISQYNGYGSSVKFAGNYVDPVSKGYSNDETEVMAQCAIVFMDACAKTSAVSQFVHEFPRDLNKAFCGFDSIRFSTPNVQIAGGNWSYGFNGNNMRIKFLQQALAAAQSNKCLVYYPYGREFEDKILPFVDWIQQNDFTVGDLFNMYNSIISEVYTGPKSRLGDLDIFECLMDLTN